MMNFTELYNQVRWKYFLVIIKDKKEYSIELSSDNLADAENEALQELVIFCGSCIDHTKLDVSLKRKLISLRKENKS